MGRLDGKVALITGAGSGIGRRTAMMFAAEDAELLIAGRRQAPLDEVVAEIGASGGKISAKSADMEDQASVEALAAHLALLEFLARAQHAGVEVVARGLDLRADRALQAEHVAEFDAARAEEPAVRKVLRRQVADRELREDDVGARLDNLVELVVDDVPLGVDHLLVGGDVVDAHLGVVAKDPPRLGTVHVSLCVQWYCVLRVLPGVNGAVVVSGFWPAFVYGFSR